MVQSSEDRRERVSGSVDLPIETRLPMDDPSVIREVEEYCAALERGDSPERGKLLEKYPEIARELTECLDGLELVYQVGPRLGETEDDETPAGSDSHKLWRYGALGDFRIIREIGRGGMGVVYEAEQISLKRSVALKVLPFAAVFDPRHLRRFKNEALAAASLDHPNIVSVYSVGCERGVYYYAMQYVEGPTLAEMIRDLRRIEGLEDKVAEETSGARGTLSDGLASGRFASPQVGKRPVAPTADHVPEEGPAKPTSETTPMAALSTDCPVRSLDHFWSIAQLGIEMAEALGHAHQHGVIHRDVKPSNVILNMEGKACVTDFGLARMETDGSLTMSGDLLGTVRYMSPEQALAKRAVVDHRTDVYSLGVTLYELLTLRPAFTGADRHELLRQIAWEEPAAPRRLNGAISADLETVVLKAMSKAPVDRYATAEELADDLRRFLENKPILARRPSLVRQAAKWSQRHQSVVWSVVVVLLLTTIGFAASTALVSREHVQTTRALTRAEENLREARDTVNNYLIRVSEEKMLDIPPLEQLRQQLLRLALVYYEGFVCQYGDDPTLQAELADALFRVGSITAQTDGAEGGLQRAAEVHRDALEIRERLAQQYPEVDEYRAGLALSYSATGVLQWLQGNSDEARHAFQKANRLWEGLVAKNPAASRYGRDLARSYGNLGVLEDQLGKPDAALGCYQSAIEVLKQLVANESPRDADVEDCLAACYGALGTSQRKTGDLDGARRSQQAALAIRKELAKRYPHSTSRQESLASSYAAIAELHTQAGNLDAAIDSRQKALEVRQRLVEENPGVIEYRASLAKGYHDLADLQKRADKPENAIDSLRVSAEVAAKIAGADPAVHGGRAQLAAACFDLGDMAGDLVELTDATALREKADQAMEELAAGDPANPTCRLGLAYSHISRGLIERRTGNLQQSLDSFRQSRSICEKLSTERPGISEYRLAWAVAGSHVAQGLRAAGELEEALDSQQTGLDILKGHVADDPTGLPSRYYLARAYQDLSTLQHDLGKPAEAESSACNARRIMRELAAEDPTWIEYSPGVVQDYRGLGTLKDVSWDARETNGAERELFDSLTGLVDETPPFHGPNLDRVLAWRLAMSPIAARYDSDLPEQSAGQATESAELDAGYGHGLGAMQYRAGDWKTAIDTLRRSIDLRLQRNGSDLLCLAMAHWRLGEEYQARKRYDEAVQWMTANGPDDPELRRCRAEAEALFDRAKVAP